MIRLPCEILSVHDGDTVTAMIYLPWQVAVVGAVRLAGYDAWECSKARRTFKVSDEEIAKGKLAKAALKELLASGKVFATPEKLGTFCPHGRKVARLSVDCERLTIDVATWMIAHGHARQGI